MVHFGQTIYRLPNRTRHLLSRLQPEDDTKALADFGTNRIIVLFVDMKGDVAWSPLYRGNVFHR
jgi:hypothetical protein